MGGKLRVCHYATGGSKRQYFSIDLKKNVKCCAVAVTPADFQMSSSQCTKSVSIM